MGQVGIRDRAIRSSSRRDPCSTELGFLAPALTEQSDIWVSGRGMHGVAEPLAMVIAGNVSTAGRRSIAPVVLRLEALHGGPRRDQGAIQRKVFPRQKPSDPFMGQQAC